MNYPTITIIKFVQLCKIQVNVTKAKHGYIYEAWLYLEPQAGEQRTLGPPFPFIPVLKQHPSPSVCVRSAED